MAAEAGAASKDDFRKQLLSLTKFLCAAAAMRRSGDETARETRAFEGVLYQVYGGTYDAVDSMVKLIEGADEKIVSVDGETLDITCKLPYGNSFNKSRSSLTSCRWQCEGGFQAVRPC